MMTQQQAVQEPANHLIFNGHTVHIIFYDGAVWFASDDIAAAMNRSASALQYVNGRHFPDIARITVPETNDDGHETGAVTFISSVGVFFFAHHTDPWKFQSLSSWAKKQALALCPDADPKDPRLFLTILPDAELPPCPKKYSGRCAEWWALKDSEEYIEARTAASAKASKERLDRLNAKIAAASTPAAPKAPGPIAQMEAQLRAIQKARPLRPKTRVPDFAAYASAAQASNP